MYSWRFRKLQKMRLLSLSEVSIQKKSSPDKFTRKLGIRDFEISFAFSLVLAFELTGQEDHAQLRERHGAVPVHVEDVEGRPQLVVRELRRGGHAARAEP